MIPKINNRGHSFKGVTAYLMHDKKASTSERVAWSETGNMHTQDIEKAALVMAYIDKNADSLKRDFGGSAAGRKSEVGNVYHYSLSWAHGENPDQQHQQEQALKTLERLGLSTHQYYMVAHDDTEHKHVHIVANLIDLETGRVHTPSFDKRELQAWALEYEKEHIMHCHKREENAKKREQGQVLKHQEQKQDYSEKITRAYYAADSGKAFIHALNEEGLELAKARRGYNVVIVDDKGNIQKLSRQLAIEEKGKLKTEVIQNLSKDIDREKLK
ncbi:MAG: relaxase/mobilization nuclease domain-containing protein, partial [Methylomarinum sp.]|nr:relaxase/mobilization nuclease domain-containing protein [Methylomarinum sp.]